MKSARIQCSWVPADFSHTLRSRHTRKPKPISIHGTPYSLFWNAEKDTPAIVHDTCHHRGASLANGGIVEGDCVKCKYHGHKTRSLYHKNIVDHNGIIWLNDSFDGLNDLPHAWEFDDAKQRVFTYQRPFEGCNPLLLVENTIDWSHLDHVHLFHVVEGNPTVKVHRTGPNGMASYTYNTKISGLTITVENEYWGPWDTCLRFKFNDTQSFTLFFSVRPNSRNDATLYVRVSRQDYTWTGPFGDFVLMMANELPLWEDREVVRKVDATRWAANKLTRDDSFLKAYRANLEENHPQLVSLYFG